jgi:hypothetical protein
MATPTKTDDFMEKLGIEMGHVRAGLAELKAKGQKLSVEARQDFEKGLQSLEKMEQDLKVRMGEWAKAGEKAGADMKNGLVLAAKDLKKAVRDAVSRLK